MPTIKIAYIDGRNEKRSFYPETLDTNNLTPLNVPEEDTEKYQQALSSTNNDYLRLKTAIYNSRYDVVQQILSQQYFIYEWANQDSNLEKPTTSIIQSKMGLEVLAQYPDEFHSLFRIVCENRQRTIKGFEVYEAFVDSFKKADLQGLDFSNVNYGEWLREVNFSRANLRFANFTGCDLLNANFSQANLENSNFSGLDLRTVNFKGADLLGVDFRGADLRGVDFSGADLRGAKFEGALLEGTNFHRAQLQGAKFNNGAQLVNAHSRGADLRGVDLSDADLRGVDFQGFVFDGANFDRAQLSNANFENASLVGADFRSANCDSTSFSNSNVNKANFFGANLQDSNFSMANLQQTNFEYANLRKANFKDAKLNSDTSFENSKLRGAVITPEQLYQSSYPNAEVPHNKHYNVFLTTEMLENTKTAMEQLKNYSVILKKEYLKDQKSENGVLAKSKYETIDKLLLTLDKQWNKMEIELKKKNYASANKARGEFMNLLMDKTINKTFSQSRDPSWLRIIAHIALSLTGIGTLVLIADTVHKETTGHHLLFGGTTTSKHVEQIKKAITDPTQKPQGPQR